MQVEGPIAKTLSFSVAARRSYVDFWFENVVPSDEIGVSSAPVYWDWQTMLAWKPTDKDRVRLTGYGSWDEMALVVKEADDASPNMRGKVAADTGFHRGALAWKHRYSDAVEHEISLASGPFGYDFDIGPDLHQEVAGMGLYGRAEWRATLAPWLRVIGGVDIQHEWGDIVYRGPVSTQIEGNPEVNDWDHAEMGSIDARVSFFRPAGYAEVSVRPVKSVEVIGGFRSDYFEDTDQVTFDPRLVTRWSLSPTLVVKGGVGLFSQPPGYGDTMEGIGNPDLDAQSAVHTDIGAEWTPAPRVKLGVDGFYKHIDDLPVNGQVDGHDTIVNGGEGRIYGAEVSARLAPGGRFSGFLSYTLSRSERNDDGTEWRLFDFDQTHILSAAGTWQINKRWSVGGTLRLVSGSPSTPVVGSLYDADRDIYEPIYGDTNSERNPTFHQLDLRVERTWRWSAGNLAAYLDVQNAYNARHVEGDTYNYDYSQHESMYGLPILPSIGLRGEI
jgi:hypothetical protein